MGKGFNDMDELQMINIDDEPARNWSISTDDNYITINHDGREYEFERIRCRTPKQVCHWVCHMAGKSWITKEMLRELVLVALGKDVWDW